MRIIQGEWIMDNFLNRLLSTVTLLKNTVNKHFLLTKSWYLLWFFLFLSLLFFGLFLAATLLLLFLASSFTFNFLFKDKINWDLIILLEVARYWNFNDRWVILQIEKKTIQMDINRSCSVVKLNKVPFHFANAGDRRFEHFLDKNALLWMNNLIVTLLESSVNFNVLDIQHGKMRPALLHSPEFCVLKSNKNVRCRQF